MNRRLLLQHLKILAQQAFCHAEFISASIFIIEMPKQACLSADRFGMTGCCLVAYSCFTTLKFLSPTLNT
jgi:hypothetical protein